MSTDHDTANLTDVRPIVQNRKSRAAPIVFGLALAIGVGSLFGALNARRLAVTSPATAAMADAAAGTIASPPPLFIPEDYAGPQMSYEFLRPVRRQIVVPSANKALLRPPVATMRVVQSSPSAGLFPLPSMAGQTEVQVQPARPGLVYQAGDRPRSVETGLSVATKDAAARASRLSAPSMTVTQGTVVQAVLESALDSNHPGFARAIVSRDVSSFDGTRVLIPKGSRLFGEYRSDVNRGQNRALIQWHRLTRPDGSIIDVDSPSADPLGRAGVRGKVNSHFFERFGGAILQSVLDAGVQVAAREASGGTVILALPNSSQVAPVVSPDQIRPTIKVRQGTSVSVLVARDLDFSDVEL